MSRYPRHRAHSRSKGPVAAAVVFALVASVLTTGVTLASSPQAAHADGPGDPPPQVSSISLASSAADFPAGGHVTLTATTDVDVAPTASTIAIVDQTSSSTLKTCATGTACEGVQFDLQGLRRI